LIGKRFGKLVVTEFAGTTKKGKKARWICQCDCGNTTTVYSTSLRTNKIMGCGKCRENIGNQYGKYNLEFKILLLAYFIEQLNIMQMREILNLN